MLFWPAEHCFRIDSGISSEESVLLKYDHEMVPCMYGFGQARD